MSIDVADQTFVQVVYHIIFVYYGYFFLLKKKGFINTLENNQKNDVQSIKIN